MSAQDAPIRPRTKAERDAFMSGYATAVEMIAKHGLGESQKWLALVADVEREMADRRG